VRSSQQRQRCATPRACFGTAGWLVRCRREHRAFPLPPKAPTPEFKGTPPSGPFRGGVLRKGRPHADGVVAPTRDVVAQRS
jgi:hypothetical protein